MRGDDGEQRRTAMHTAGSEMGRWVMETMRVMLMTFTMVMAVVAVRDAALRCDYLTQ